MAAEDNGSWQQLGLYMTAKELKEGITHSYDRGGRWLDALWDKKLQESKTGAIRNARYMPTRDRGTNNLYSSIKEKGVQKLVEVAHPRKNAEEGEKGLHLVEGHHRVAAAYDIDPNMLIPVIHEYHRTKHSNYVPPYGDYRD